MSTSIYRRTGKAPAAPSSQNYFKPPTEFTSLKALIPDVGNAVKLRILDFSALGVVKVDQYRGAFPNRDNTEVYTTPIPTKVYRYKLDEDDQSDEPKPIEVPIVEYDTKGVQCFASDDELNKLTPEHNKLVTEFPNSDETPFAGTEFFVVLVEATYNGKKKEWEEVNEFKILEITYGFSNAIKAFADLTKNPAFLHEDTKTPEYSIIVTRNAKSGSKTYGYEHDAPIGNPHGVRLEDYFGVQAEDVITELGKLYEIMSDPSSWMSQNDFDNKFKKSLRKDTSKIFVQQQKKETPEDVFDNDKKMEVTSTKDESGQRKFTAKVAEDKAEEKQEEPAQSQGPRKFNFRR